MFREPFNAVIRAIKLKREKDGDGICLAPLSLAMKISEEQLVELGPEVAAMVASRKVDGGVLLPFSKASLDQDHDDLLLSVYDVHGVKFSAQGCKATKLVLLKDPDDPGHPVLQWDVFVPPLKQAERNYLEAALECPSRLMLNHQQPELELAPAGKTVVKMQGREVRLHEGDCTECGVEGMVTESGMCMACMVARQAANEEE